MVDRFSLEKEKYGFDEALVHSLKVGANLVGMGWKLCRNKPQIGHLVENFVESPMLSPS